MRKSHIGWSSRNRPNSAVNKDGVKLVGFVWTELVVGSITPSNIVPNIEDSLLKLDKNLVINNSTTVWVDIAMID